ncbi:MAG TPA: AMP-binding protein [Acidimicrobiales bacterium]|nr:AMP-binding protein [Acidimicrobiales bacterium]
MPEIKPLGQLFTDRAAEAPDAPAVTVGADTITRGELESRANRTARHYEQLGVGVGDFVTIALPNSIEFFVATAAVWKLGAVPQPISWRLPRRERQEIVELADPKLIVGVEADDHPGRTTLPVGAEIDASLDDSPLPGERISPAWKAPTSGGSTGRPKVIVAGQPGLFPKEVGAGWGMAPDDVQLVPGPMYHSAPFGWSFFGLWMGHHIIVLPRFDPEVALQAVHDRQVTWACFVPTMLRRMLRVIDEKPGRFDLSSLRMLWHMGAPCAPWLKERWIELVGPDRVFELYGGTEAQAIAVISGREWLEKRGAVGKPALGEMMILDPQGNQLPPGEIGEIYMRSPSDEPPRYHYVGAEARVRDGWESLGDMGWMDEDGYVYISDRRTDMIVTGGANVYPAEVEAAIDEHPLVESSAVVGIPDDDLGQRVHAVVHAADGLTDDALLAHLEERLVKYKLPRSIEFVDEQLRDDAGKVRRAAVREAVLARQSVAG